MMRFHLDEHVDPAIAAALRQRGVEVSTTQSAGLLAATDETHIAYAFQEQRVIFTNESDFLRLAAQGIAHAGIVYAAPNSRSIGEVVRHLCLLHDCSGENDMRGRVDYLWPKRGR